MMNDDDDDDDFNFLATAAVKYLCVCVTEDCWPSVLKRHRLLTTWG